MSTLDEAIETLKRAGTAGPRASGPVSPLRKEFSAVDVRVVDSKQRRLGIVISTEAEDRDGDIIEVAGWDLTNYRRNPVVLFAHDYRSPAVGKAISVVKDTVGQALRSVVEFAPTEMGRQLFELYAGKYMRAWSVGFLPKESVRRRETEDGYTGRGVRFRRQELLEYSAVPVPANAEALTDAVTRMARGASALQPTGSAEDPDDAVARLVYAAERRVIHRWPLGRSVPRLEASDLVARACRIVGLAPIRIVQGHRDGRAKRVRGRPLIFLSERGLRPLYILHEVAHHAAGLEHGHDADFRRRYKHLVSRLLGHPEARALAQAFREKGLDD